MSNELLNNLDKLHITALWIERIKKNLYFDILGVVEWCKQRIIAADDITRTGKNWYVYSDNCVITINAHSYTIITVHGKKEEEAK